LSAPDLLLDRLNGFKWGGAEVDGVSALLLLRLHPDIVTTHVRRRAEHQRVADALEALIAEQESREPPDSIVRRVRLKLEAR
jgi:hypothetical protein